MGNCIHRQGAISWVDDDDEWEPEESTSQANNHNKVEHSEVRGKGVHPSTEVKIKITRKQLEKLLKQVDAKGATVQEILADLMSNGDTCPQDRHWKPALQSIPEAYEDESGFYQNVLHAGRDPIVSHGKSLTQI